MSPSRAFGPRVGAHPFAAQSPTAGSNLAGNLKPVLKTGIAIAAMLILMVPLITVTADDEQKARFNSMRSSSRPVG